MNEDRFLTTGSHHTFLANDSNNRNQITLSIQMMMMMMMIGEVAAFPMRV
jgi:hypothetical protein